jgi:maleate isomerase
MTGGRVTTVVSRTGSLPRPRQPAPWTAPPAHAQLLASTGSSALDHAAITFNGTMLAAVAHASTTAGYVIGHREEAVLVERLSQRFDVPAVTTCAAAAAALRTHGIGQVQLVHPPWFADEFDELGMAYFRSQGFEAVVTKAVGLPDDPARVDPQPVIDWVEHHIQDRADAVFLAGNGFRAAGAIEELESRTGRLILEANQALLWSILAATGRSDGSGQPSLRNWKRGSACSEHEEHQARQVPTPSRGRRIGYVDDPRLDAQTRRPLPLNAG